MHRIRVKNVRNLIVIGLSNISKNCQKPFSLTVLKHKDQDSKYFSDQYELHEPGENFKNKNYIPTEHTQRLLKEHLQATGGQVRTRFPPEPNGLLHIGHAKAINISFGYAKAKKGICFLRYDDTNPEMGEECFVQGIQEMVEWLGFQPYKITYASDYFQQLYEWAEKLVEKDLAYVCHQPPEADNSEGSPWRNRPQEESLHEFKAMKNRKYKEKEVTLRLKMTTQQRTVDPVAYRIKNAPHHRTGDEWCVYPTYDYAHGLCDSIENITHSLCTSEFALRRSTYYWICNALEVYCPVQTEFGRLNFLNTVVSKRKINALIQAGVVSGWDDPRLYTLAALRRRGFPPAAINAFSANFGLQPQSAFIHPSQLHYYVREHLENTATRIMVVLRPLRVVITNYPHEGPKRIEVADLPSDRSKGVHTITFDREIWIEETDFIEESDKKFRRLTLKQGVGLRYTGHVINVTEIVRNSRGEVDHLRAECVPVKQAKRPKAFIHWVAEPVDAEIRLYDNLFKSERPDDLKTVPGGFLSDVNPHSLTTLTGLVGSCSLSPFDPYQRFQFERTGYFVVDSHSTDHKLAFNRILELRQDKGF